MKKLLFLLCGLFWIQMAFSQVKLDVDGDVKIRGKIDILDNTNGVFIGFNAGKVDDGNNFGTFIGVNAGQSNTSGIDNTFIGSDAGRWNNIGQENTFIGSDTGEQNTSGQDNTFVGDDAGFVNTSGSQNTFIGGSAGRASTIGHGNTFLGQSAGRYNTAGYSNVAIGLRALYNNTDQGHLVAVGDSALYHNGLNVTLGSQAKSNTAVGSKAMFLNTSGRDNTAVGFEALLGNLAGNYNTATGFRALYENKGISNTANGYLSLLNNRSGDYNTALGSRALTSNESGSNNVASGFNALYNNITGNNNVASGYDALIKNTIGSENTAIGYGAGSVSDNSNRCTFLGYDADQGTLNNLSNSMALGYISRILGSNQIRIGNTSVTSIGGYTTWSNFSDGRFKNKVKEDVPGLDFILQLRPVTYNLQVDKLANYLQEDQMEKIDGGNKGNPQSDLTIQQARTEKSKIRYTGFIAQEVEKVAEKIGYDFSGIDKPENEEDLYGLRYAEFVVPLVKAVQEQQEELATKTEQIEALQQEVNELKKIVQQLLTQGSNVLEVEPTPLTDAQLFQNEPNPFDNTTSIRFFVPEGIHHAFLLLIDTDGKQLKKIPILGRGLSQISISTAGMSDGIYFYSLMLDNQRIDTKTMVLTRS